MVSWRGEGETEMRVLGTFLFSFLLTLWWWAGRIEILTLSPGMRESGV